MESTLTPGMLTSLPGRYAKALFELAQESEEINDVGTALRFLQKLIQTSAALRGVLENPTIPREEQTEALKEICHRMKVPDVVQSFIDTLLKGGRISYLSKIEKLYRSLVAQKKGEKVIEVISAHPLTASQGRLLKKQVKKAFPGSVHLTFTRDPRVLGGVMVRAGSWIIDATLVTQLNQLATVMKGDI